ncbi:MAG: adenosylcobinamide-GDP ribazoletransferase [Ilumatobacteraceae bacterium]
MPVRTRDAVPWRRVVGWLPLVGLAIGAVVGGVYAAMRELTEAPLLSAAVAVAVGMMITGAFHEDGLADVADAIAGGSTPAARLRILDDPRHGTYGVAALAASIVLRVTALGALGNATGAVAATLAHGLGRGGAVAVMGLAPARATGLAAAAHTDIAGRARTAGITVTIVVAALLSGWWVAVAVAASICSTAVVTADVPARVRRHQRRRPRRRRAGRRSDHVDRRRDAERAPLAPVGAVLRRATASR